MKIGATFVAFGLRPFGVAADPYQFRYRIFQILAAARSEGFDVGQINRQIVIAETQYPRFLVIWRIMDQHAVG